jgi:hypothetical protein
MLNDESRVKNKNWLRVKIETVGETGRRIVYDDLGT